MNGTLLALLRGVNVNGINIKMSELQSTFIDMGFTGVKTVLNTGNVIFTTNQEAEEKEIKAAIEAALRQRFHYDAHVFIRDAGMIENILAAAQAVPISEDCHQYAIFCDDSDPVVEFISLFDTIPHLREERVIAHGREVFWIVPKEMTLESPFGSKVLGSKLYKSLLTSRNINTVLKIGKAMK